MFRLLDALRPCWPIRPALFSYIEGPRYVGPTLERRADGWDRDIWGVLRRPVRVQVAHGVETYMEVAESPPRRGAHPGEHGHRARDRPRR